MLELASMANSHLQPPPISPEQPFWKRRWVVLVATVLLTAVVGSFTNEIVSRLLNSGGDRSKPTVTQNDEVAAQEEKDRQTKVALEAKKLSAIPPYPADAVEFQGHRYKVFQEQLSWSGAKARCIGMGGHLPIVTSKRENDFLTQLSLKTLRAYERRDGIWLGATDEVQEGNWLWLDGSPVTFNVWGVAQPNNKQQAEHYLMLYLTANNWSDQPNVSKQHRTFFACEWDSISTVKSGPE